MDKEDLLIKNLVESDLKIKRKDRKKYTKERIFISFPISENYEIEVAKVSWFNKKAKYEIRKWKKDGTAGKGLTMDKEAFINLINLIKEMEIE